MALTFTKATRKKVYLKLGIMGPSGSGKSYSALQLAKGLADGGKIAAIDTENGSLSLYADVADFDVIDLEPPFTPAKYQQAITAAVEAGYRVLIIDSQTHAWKQILEEKEAIDRQGGNSFTNWGKVKPKYDALKDSILQSPIHIISCMRAKDEIVLTKNDRGKDVPQKVGMGAIAEPGAEYEYTVVWTIGMDHGANASKDRTGLFADSYHPITPKDGQKLLKWLEAGVGEMPRQSGELPEGASEAMVKQNATRIRKDDWKWEASKVRDMNKAISEAGDEPAEVINYAYEAGVKTPDQFWQVWNYFIEQCCSFRGAVDSLFGTYDPTEEAVEAEVMA
jgi:AAA domain